VPLYECPTNTSQDIDGIKNLTPVHDGISWVYLRISSPGENDYDNSYNLYPESSHVKVFIFINIQTIRWTMLFPKFI